MDRQGAIGRWRGKGGREGKEGDVLVVVGDITGEGGETDIGREREGDAVDGETVGPLVPWKSCRPLSVYRTHDEEMDSEIRTSLVLDLDVEVLFTEVRDLELCADVRAAVVHLRHTCWY